MSFIRAELPDAEVAYFPAFFDKVTSESLLAALLELVSWKQEPITIFGREVMQPRLVAWYGDPDCLYTYSGRTNTPLPWIQPLLEIKASLTAAISRELPEYLPVRFNSVLLNLYRDGNDAMGWHADNEAELGPHPLIASVSLGSPRAFRLRHSFNKEISSRLYSLGDGDLLVMGGRTQECWKHQVARTRKPVGARVNLTFRYILPAANSNWDNR